MQDIVKRIVASPMSALRLGLVLGAAVLVLWIAAAGTDRAGLFAFIVRWLHIVSAVIWLGMIWFVNFIQLAALSEAEPAARGPILKYIVPRVADTFRTASHWTVASGVVLLVTSGYIGGSLYYGAPVQVGGPRTALMWGGTIAAMAMYMFVHMMIWPGLRLVLGIDKGDDAAVAAARTKVATFARWNLVLAVPVTVAMVAAAHL